MRHHKIDDSFMYKFVYILVSVAVLSAKGKKESAAVVLQRTAVYGNIVYFHVLLNPVKTGMQRGYDILNY